MFAAPLLVFAPALLAGFVAIDDPDLVTENRFARGGISWPGVVAAFTEVQAHNRTPLAFLSHMLDVELFGLSPAGHHATSVLFHAVATLLAYGWLRRATGDDVRSALVALLFGLHPLRVESVTWVSERRDVLSMAFGLGALLLWARYVAAPGAGRYAAVLAAFAASLASKATFVTLPALLLVLDGWPHRRLGAAGPGLRRLVVEKLPLLVLSAVAGLATLSAQDRALAEAPALPILLRAENAVVSAVVYLRQLVWPVDLAVFVPHPGVIAPARVFAAAAILGIVTGLAVRFRDRAPWIFAGWLFYGISLLPVIGLVQVGAQAHADRYTYLPLLGITIALVWSVPDAALAARSARLTLALVVALLALRTVQQIGVWRDGVTLFEHTLRVTRDNAMAHRHLGVALGRVGREEEAAAQYREALRLRPAAVSIRYDLALALARSGRPDEAERELALLLASDPRSADAHTLHATLLLVRGDGARGLAHLEEAVAIGPDVALYRRNLGLAYARADRAADAERELAEAVRLEPWSADGRNWLGFLLAARGDETGARAQFEAALQADPQHAEARANLARLGPQSGPSAAGAPGAAAP